MYRRNLSIIYQSEGAECGLACIAMIADFYEIDADLRSLRSTFSVSMSGASIRNLMTVASRIGLGARALRLEVEAVKSLRCPAILHWDLNHFVVLKSTKNGFATIHDPGAGIRRMPLSKLSEHFTGVAIELEPTGEFEPLERAPKPRLSQFWSKIRGLRESVFQIFTLTLLLQLFTLALPVYLQIVVDEAVVRFDVQFLMAVGAAFAILTIYNAVTELLRGYLIATLGQQFTFQLAGNILHHMLRLKTTFFEKRSIGDIISRLGSIRPIKDAITRDMITVLLDGAFAILMLALMALYSWQLTLIVLATTGVYVVTVILLFPLKRIRQEALITAMAREETHMIETVRATRAVKLFGREMEREAGWRNRYADVVNASIDNERILLGLSFANSVCLGLQLVLVVFVGALFIIAEKFTIGMLFAFIAYRQTFAQRATQLVERGLDFRLLGLHVDRLSDIVLTKREEPGPPANAFERIAGKIEARNIFFRYSVHDKFVLENASLVVVIGVPKHLEANRSGGQKRRIPDHAQTVVSATMEG